MRDIEFRGKRSNGEWVYGNLIALDADSGYVYITKPYTPANTLPFRYIIEGNTYLVDPNTVGQYTGLRDKNGVKIYEGDILHVVSFMYDYKTNVGARNGYMNGFYVDGDFGDADFTILDWAADYWRDDDAEVEVIGNIHDNPELL